MIENRSSFHTLSEHREGGGVRQTDGGLGPPTPLTDNIHCGGDGRGDHRAMFPLKSCPLKARHATTTS